MAHIDGLPDFRDCSGTLSVCVCGQSAFIRCARFIARIDLPSGEIDWLVERSPTKVIESTYRSPRYINLFGSGSEIWASDADRIVAELISTECGGMNVSARDAATGRQLWEHFVPTPRAAEWAEPTPAWPGAQTEEIYGFIAKDTRRLIVCLARNSRRSGFSCPAHGISVLSRPPYSCQTDAICFHLSTGKPIWRAEFQDVSVGIIERRSFTGIWSKSPRLGVIDFESGTNSILVELPHAIWLASRTMEPIIAVSWHANGEVGVDWFDQRGCRLRGGSWRQPRVHHTYLHPTEAGLGMQTNDQTFWWLDEECQPLWNVRAKPYIYRVHRSPDTDVFIGTDGNGGRLLALDARSGRETLNPQTCSWRSQGIWPTYLGMRRWFPRSACPDRIRFLPVSSSSQ